MAASQQLTTRCAASRAACVRNSGTVHVASIAVAPGELEHAPRCLSVSHPRCPRSAGDAFLLGLVRAAADDVVTSSANLRAEPGLVVSLRAESLPDMGEITTPAFLRRWRADSKPRDEGVLAVLTHSGDVELNAALLREPLETRCFRPLLIVSRDNSGGLMKRVDDAGGGLEVVPVGVDGVDELSAAAAARWLHRRGGPGRIVSVEAGPRLSRSLYTAPAACSDTVVLGVRLVEDAADLPAGSLVQSASPFSTSDLLHDCELVAGSRVVDTSGTGQWAFVLLHRKSAN